MGRYPSSKELQELVTRGEKWRGFPNPKFSVKQWITLEYDRDVLYCSHCNHHEDEHTRMGCLVGKCPCNELGPSASGYIKTEHFIQAMELYKE